MFTNEYLNNIIDLEHARSYIHARATSYTHMYACMYTASCLDPIASYIYI